MKKHLLPFILLSILLFVPINRAFSQEADSIIDEKSNIHIKEKPFQSWGMGVNLGTTGLGINAITKLNPHFYARIGFDYMGFNYKPDDMELDAEYEGDDVTASITSLNLNFSKMKLLFDYYPFRKGIFSLTAGLYFGKNELKMKGNAPQEFELEDMVIKPDANGYFDMSLVMGNSLKPYFGIGLGHTLTTNKRLGFRFELGAIYQGHYKIESDYMTKELLSEANDALEDALPKAILDFWPVLNFNLSYKFK